MGWWANNKVLLARALDLDDLPAGGLAFDDSDITLAYPQPMSKVFDQGFICLPLYRRCRNPHLQSTVMKALYLIPSGVGVNVYR